MTDSPLPFRVGFGYDIHPFAEGRPLVLGGVTIPSPRGLAGHSDADVLTHALADAILGASGLPDIGHYFPNFDPTIKGIDSQKILVRAVTEAAERGYVIGNVDLTLIAESPKIAPHLTAIKERLGKSLGIAPGEIGLKATTNEKLGSLGRNEGIAAHAVVLLMRRA